MSVTNLTEENFDREVLSSEKPVLVDFWAPWCGPCRAVAPIVEDLARAFAGRAKIAKLNVDEAPAIAERYGVQGIPSLLFFRGGKLVDRVVGAAPRSELEARLERAAG
jgi:thioredoxin 1